MIFVSILWGPVTGRFSGTAMTLGSLAPAPSAACGSLGISQACVSVVPSGWTEREPPSARRCRGALLLRVPSGGLGKLRVAPWVAATAGVLREVLESPEEVLTPPDALLLLPPGRGIAPAGKYAEDTGVLCPWKARAASYVGRPSTERVTCTGRRYRLERFSVCGSVGSIFITIRCGEKRVFFVVQYRGGWVFLLPLSTP